MQHLTDSGLLEASNCLYISCIARNNEDIMELVDILRQYAADKIEFVSKTTNPQRFEFPALDYMYEKSQHEDFLFYYFHTKGITYQTTLHQEDREFKGFVDKIVAWRRMMEFFLMNQWKVAVNTLEAGQDVCRQLLVGEGVLFQNAPCPRRRYQAAQPFHGRRMAAESAGGKGFLGFRYGGRPVFCQDSAYHL